jgi:P2-related tail formation protein
MSVADLLPPNSQAFERSAAEGMSDTLPVPLRQVMDPAATPVPFLPFLAAHRGVDLWYSDWTLSRKRLMVENAVKLSALKGTVAAPAAYLAYVDGEILDKISYPAPFTIGRDFIGRDDIIHRAFVARFLVRVRTYTKGQAMVLGRGTIGRHVLRRADLEPFKRCLKALRISKAMDTQYRVDFAHQRRITLADSVPLDGSFTLGDFVPRTRL